MNQLESKDPSFYQDVDDPLLSILPLELAEEYLPSWERRAPLPTELMGTLVLSMFLRSHVQKFKYPRANNTYNMNWIRMITASSRENIPTSTIKPARGIVVSSVRNIFTSHFHIERLHEATRITQVEKATFHSLSDILIDIFTFIPASLFLQFRTVSKAWNLAILNTPLHVLFASLKFYSILIV